MTAAILCVVGGAVFIVAGVFMQVVVDRARQKAWAARRRLDRD